MQTYAYILVFMEPKKYTTRYIFGTYLIKLIVKKMLKSSNPTLKVRHCSACQNNQCYYGALIR